MAEKQYQRLTTLQTTDMPDFIISL